MSVEASTLSEEEKKSWKIEKVSSDWKEAKEPSHTTHSWFEIKYIRKQYAKNVCCFLMLSPTDYQLEFFYDFIVLVPRCLSWNFIFSLKSFFGEFIWDPRPDAAAAAELVKIGRESDEIFVTAAA